ncbi:MULTISPECIES: GNAT family N-acetyltransferase [unclassified Streptomyces]|uniref:GNAT family N-acetyltransferase n=1 Tax=unclassified Streptomyces TaxID=2593676 RepID=UPI000978EB3D|nr:MULTISPECIES: GNAT family N-acetyltransferase [unclassified Streptomyces]ONI55653.1 Ribosomal-protein-serine acetyltransferase [Streptomyces sp. IB2014 011-1]RDV53405.1 N-acetyltransferase [Streptomyces sp. IB2014 011-12]
MDELTAPEGFLLRPWLPADASAVLRAFAPAEMDRQSDRPVSDRADALAWIADRTREWGARTGYSWAVVGEEGEALGCVAVRAVNRAHDTGWVSYWTTEAARGRGVAPAGVRALTRWAFGELGLYRLELGHRTDNPASCRVAVRAGFAPEGIERGKLRYGDVRYDVERHARLADDVVNFD